jgi:hypothetical protein
MIYEEKTCSVRGSVTETLNSRAMN